MSANLIENCEYYSRRASISNERCIMLFGIFFLKSNNLIETIHYEYDH